MTDKKKYIERGKAGEAAKGKVLHSDKTRDLVLLQLDRLPATAKQLALAKQSSAVGERAWHIGSPGAVNQLFSFSESKVRSFELEKLSVASVKEELKIECKLGIVTNVRCPGDSGGPYVNAHGDFIGVDEVGIRTKIRFGDYFVDVEEVHKFLAEKKVKLNPVKVAK